MNPTRDFAIWAASMLPPDASDMAVAITVMASLLLFFAAIGAAVGLIGYLIHRRSS